VWCAADPFTPHTAVCGRNARVAQPCCSARASATPPPAGGAAPAPTQRPHLAAARAQAFGNPCETKGGIVIGPNKVAIAWPEYPLGITTSNPDGTISVQFGAFDDGSQVRKSPNGRLLQPPA